MIFSVKLMLPRANQTLMISTQYNIKMSFFTLLLKSQARTIPQTGKTLHNYRFDLSL